MMDRFEYGCDYSSSVVSKGECGEGLPCYGDQSPTGAGVSPGPYSNAFYNRSTGTCYVNTGSWSEVGGLNAAQLSNEFVGPIISTSRGMKGRLAGLPPLTRVSQSQAQNICKARSNSSSPIILENGVSTISINGSYFRIPSRVEQVALAAWDTDLYTDSQISILEKGPDLNTSPKCNSLNADTVPGFTDAPVLLSPGIHTLPGTESSSIRSLATGNDFTSLCASRYQVRSLIGNVREWSDEQFTCTLSCKGSGANTGAYRGPISGSSPPLMAPPYVFDGTAGNRGPLVSIFSWIIAEEDNSTTFFDFPVALPLNQNVIDFIFEIGQTSGITTAQLHSDTFTVTEATSVGVVAAGLLYGGSHGDSTGAGRYYGSLEHSETADVQTGFRCFYPISPAAIKRNRSSGLMAQIGLLNFWVFKQLLGGAFHKNFTRRQDVGPVGNVKGRISILFHKQNGGTPFIDFLNSFKDILHQDRGNSQGGFVQEQEARIGHAGPGNGQHLLFTTGEGSRKLLFSFF